MGAVKILIIEDDILLRDLLQATLSAEAGFEVVGSSADGGEAMRLAQQLVPDAIVMDIELEGDIDGIDAALEIKRELPGTRIVFLSAHRERKYMDRLLSENAVGWAYLQKGSVTDLATLIRAIRSSVEGMVVVDPGIVENLRPLESPQLARLTPRQYEVLEVIAQGYANAAIAQRLQLTRRSVDTYVAAVYQTLELTEDPDRHPRVAASQLYLKNTE